MNYPTHADVEAADVVQLARWHRFLPSPSGHRPEPTDNEALWSDRIDHEFAVLRRIIERFQQLGGWTPELSRTVGFTPPTA